MGRPSPPPHGVASAGTSKMPESASPLAQVRQGSTQTQRLVMSVNTSASNDRLMLSSSET